MVAPDSRDYSTEAGVPAWTLLPMDEVFQVLAAFAGAEDRAAHDFWKEGSLTV